MQRKRRVGLNYRPVQQAEADSFGWPWPQRQRTTVEYEHVYERVYEACRNRGMSDAAADAEALTVCKLLPITTEQPISAARWLERRKA